MTRRFLTLFLLLLLVAACSPAAIPNAAPPAVLLATPVPNPSPTPTPFLPLPDTDVVAVAPGVRTPTALPTLMAGASATQPAPLPTGLPTVTPGIPVQEPAVTVTSYDPNFLLPGPWTPATIYAPAYAPTPFPILSDSETLTFLLLGSDSRGERYFRTDTLILAAVRPRSGQVTLISIPRDLYVYVPNHGMDRINTAYEYGELERYPGGGPALLRDTILYNLGVRIDHLALVDFDGFRRIVDTLGGIDVPVFCPYTDWRLRDPGLNPEIEDNWALYTVGPGVVHMDGDLALWYARSRVRSNDFDRGRRQQEVLRSIYTRALQTDSFSQIPQLYNDFHATLTTDLNLQGLLELAPLALHLSNADIRSYYIGSSYTTGWTTATGASVLLPNGPALLVMLSDALAPSSRTPETEQLLIEVRNGTLSPGWDALAAERLNYAGYATRLIPADRSNYAASLLYDLTAVQDPNRAASLLAILGLPTSALVSAPMPDAGVAYVLIVGTNYQPCFNPENMAP
ncbi:MAG: LCP family protein [Anaerolineales bacterium]|nr:LCP family protein [Anaerolineales bacterium]